MFFVQYEYSMICTLYSTVIQWYVHCEVRVFNDMCTLQYGYSMICTLYSTGIQWYVDCTVRIFNDMYTLQYGYSMICRLYSTGIQWYVHSTVRVFNDMYTVQYGYLPELSSSNAPLISSEGFSQALRKLQRTGGEEHQQRIKRLHCEHLLWLVIIYCVLSLKNVAISTGFFPNLIGLFKVLFYLYYCYTHEVLFQVYQRQVDLTRLQSSSSNPPGRTPIMLLLLFLMMYQKHYSD